ncbi:MAG: type IV pilus biogenesis/stability protein PilW [Motiliproteus sp.]|nr:type IV pilus biogenesis/stability protein PilW [Motiliproteus sp.]
MKQLTVIMMLCALVLTGCQSNKTTIAPKRTDEARIDVRMRWAKEHIQLAEYEEAKRPLTSALDIDPNHPKVLNLLAFVFQQQGEIALAEKYYKQMLKADSSFAAGQNNFGAFLMLQRRYQEACGYFDKASANPLYEGRPQALENLASCYMLSGEKERAEATFRNVLRLNPNSGTTIIELANLIYQRGESGEAWALFSRFSELVNSRRIEHSAKSLWLGVQLSRDGQDPGMAATYALLLKNLYPNSLEYQLYKESKQ